ncbi:unnamed protein product [Calicophoron daubneyi]|uniref:EF-hand domain-containing protein n=1 Tax=Calicophoron daubneyi TaxID=300641 RepID=A0AAV2T8V5_CALDB
MAQCSTSDLEKMIAKFLEIDTNKDETVDLEELRAACLAEKLSIKDIQNWLDKFDTDENGKITLEEFCRAMGLKSEEMRDEKSQREKERAGTAPKIADDTTIIASTMSADKQADVVRKFRELMKSVSGKQDEMNAVVRQMKAYMDTKYGQVWHIIIMTGSYWMKFSHEPFMSIQFKQGNHICMAWRTPRG